MSKLIGAGAMLVGAAGLLGASGLYTVEGGQRAVLFSRISGIQPNVTAEGLHWRVPWFERPIIYDIRAKPRKISSPTGTKDLQTVNIGLRVLYRPDPTRLPYILGYLGTDYDERVLPSILNEVLKSVVAKFNASQLITQRQQVSLMVRKELDDTAKDFNIIIDDLAITELAFGHEYTAAIEAKQVAQQEAQRAQFVVEKAIQERSQRIVEAEGEAASAKLIGDAVKKNPGYLKLRKLQAAQNIAGVMSKSFNNLYLNSSTLMVDINTENFEGALAHLKK